VGGKQPAILRGMPIPPVFIRLSVDPVKKRTVREVIDGQQRLRAVLGYMRDEFTVLKVHNPEVGGILYSELPNDIQRQILSYQFHVNFIEDIPDSEVLNIFARLNTYTVPLNAQELRNARFFGAFKHAVYSIAHRHYQFWTSNKIVSDAQIARMSDAELVSILMLTVLDGFRETKAKDINYIYEEFDDKFVRGRRHSQEFDTIIDIIGEIFRGEMSETSFKRTPLFFSVFCAIYDAKFGLPGSKHRKLILSAKSLSGIRSRLYDLDRVISMAEPPKKLEKFVQATRLSTADVSKRKLRHDILWSEVLAPSNR
jgi:hypothetical protein